MVYGFRPKQPIDLILMVDHYRVSESASLPHMHELHKVISDKTKQSNLNYKLQAGVRKKFKNFNVGDLVMIWMIWICLKWFTPRTVKKLHTRSAGTFKILTKLNNITYVIDLLEYFEINLTFNIEDLVEYNSPNLNPSNLLVDESTPEPFSERPYFLHS